MTEIEEVLLTILYSLKDLWTHIETDPSTTEQRRNTARIHQERIVKRINEIKEAKE